MAAEHLYIDEDEEYFGLLKARPQIPQDQVWVFSRANEQPPSICVWGTEDARPPSAPWFARFAMQIRKFYQSATFTWRFPLYEHFPLQLNISVTTTLVDPVSYLLEAREAEKRDKQALKDVLQQNRLVTDALLKALHNILAFERQRDPLSPQKQQQGLEQVTPLTLCTLNPDNLSRLLTDSDLGLYLQNSPMMRKLGVRIQVTVREAQLPPVYKLMVKNVQRSLEKELLEARDLILSFKEDIDSKGGTLPREELLTLGQKLYTNLGNYYEGKRSKIESVLIKLIEQILRPAQGNADSALLAAAFFKDIAGMEIEKPLQDISIATTRELVAARAPVEPASAEKPEDTRNKHINDLYDAVTEINSETKDWKFAPEDRNKVKEIILIDIGDYGIVELQVPQRYPQEQPAVRARKGKEAISQKEVNKRVQPILRPEGYNLVSIVKAVALELHPRDSRSKAASKEDEQETQPLASEDTVELREQPAAAKETAAQPKQLPVSEAASKRQKHPATTADMLEQAKQHLAEEEAIQRSRNTSRNISRVRKEQAQSSNPQRGEHIDLDR